VERREIWRYATELEVARRTACGMGRLFVLQGDSSSWRGWRYVLMPVLSVLKSDAVCTDV